MDKAEEENNPELNLENQQKDDTEKKQQGEEQKNNPNDQQGEIPSKSEYESFARWTILSVTTLSSFMIALDSSIVTIALPKIANDLSSGVSLLGWVITAYILASAALLLQYGKAGDKYGRKKIYLMGFGLFGLTSALCGISQNIYELVAFRAFQGSTAAMLGATGPPIVFDSFPPKERGSALGINSIAWAVGSIAGPVAGGFLVSVTWRLIFYINVPVAIAAVVVGMKRIPKKFNEGWLLISSTRSPNEKNKDDNSISDNYSKRRDLNLVGSALLAFTVSMVLIWLTFFDFWFIIIGVVCLALLAIEEKRSSNPLLAKKLTKERGFVYSIAALGISQISFLGIPFALSFYYQTIIGLTPVLTGILLAPLSISLVVMNPVSGRLFDRLRSPATLALIGAFTAGISTVALSLFIAEQASPVYIDTLLVVLGAGAGLIWTPLLTTTLRFAKPELRGVANGTAFTLVNMGFAASIAVTVAVSAAYLPQSLASQIYLGSLSSLTSTQISFFNRGISEALLTLGAINFVDIPIILLVLRRQRQSGKGEENIASSPP
jgi:MFS family permease